MALPWWRCLRHNYGLKRCHLARGWGGGWGYSIYLWVGRCSQAPNTLTLFKTKIADVPTLFKTEFRFLIPCLRHLTRNHTLCKTIINIETLSLFNPLAMTKLYTAWSTESRRLFIVQEKIPCLRQKLINSIPCLRQKSRKTYPGWPHVPIKPLSGSTPWGLSLPHPYIFLVDINLLFG